MKTNHSDKRLTSLLLFLLCEIIERVGVAWNFNVLKSLCLFGSHLETSQLNIIRTLSYYLSHNPVISSIKAQVATFKNKQIC